MGLNATTRRVFSTKDQSYSDQGTLVAMSDADLSISLWDKVNAIGGIFTIRNAHNSRFIANEELIYAVVVAGYSSIAALFRGSDGAVTWGREVLHRVVRYQTGVLSLKQRR